MSDDKMVSAEAVLRSLVNVNDYATFEYTQKYNTGNGPLNLAIQHLIEHGYLTELQHKRYKDRLNSGELNSHLNSTAKKYKNFYVIDGKLK